MCIRDRAWSPATALFQDISGLLDPRVGRGFYSTWNVEWPLLRFPLDHVFVSRDFELARIECVDVAGADHRGLLVDLRIDPAAREAPDATAAERSRAQETVEDGRDTSPSGE